VLISRFAAVYPLVRLAGGSSRTAFISSGNLSQISEFSLVIAALGVSLGHLTDPLMSAILYAMTITAIASSYMIKYNHQIHYFFSKIMRRRDPQALKKETKETRNCPIIILGLHRGSQYLIEMIAKKMPMLLPQILVIDYNIEALTKLRSIGVAGYLGDISRADVLEKAGISRANIIIATIPPMLLKGTSISRLVELCRGLAPHAEIIASADFKSQIAEMKEAGASRIIMPYYVAGEECADIVISLSGRILE
jgi:hypothetical protein